MDTPSKHQPETGHKHSDQARIRRGLALFREHGDEIAETSPGVYRVPGSDDAEYTVRLDAAYCSCPDRALRCKHLFAVTICAAKKNAGCRRQCTGRPTRQPSRRHGERREDTRDDRRDARRGTAPARSGGIDPARIRANVARMEG